LHVGDGAADVVHFAAVTDVFGGGYGGKGEEGGEEEEMHYVARG